MRAANLSGWVELATDERVSVLFEGGAPVRVSVTLAEGEEMQDGLVEELVQAACTCLDYGEKIELVGQWEAAEGPGEAVRSIAVVGAGDGR